MTIVNIVPEVAHEYQQRIKVSLKKQVSYCSSKTMVMKDTSKILIALGVGLAIGGVLGVLFAPDKGSVTRHKIADETKKTPGLT
ncbi:MAG TPA: YtxH domain-containing protein [Chitinophagaceae bacterium]|nr:YtxH domain-containing protein [Chitinophagaceae bacterium]